MQAGLPNDEVIEKLVQNYIEECDKIVPGYAKAPENSFAAHLKEIRLMLLANTLFFISLMMKQQESIVPAMVFDAKKQMVTISLILTILLIFTLILAICRFYS